jgi:CRISPR-associated protein (TIGR03984 family)
MKKLDYEIKNDTKSTSKKIEVTTDLKNLINTTLSRNEYNVVAYLDYGVFIGLLKKENDSFEFIFNEKIDIEDKYIQKIRIFDKNEELLLWKSNNTLKGRLRIDESGSGSEYVDVSQVLFGTKTENIDDNFTKLIEEDRRISITIPSKFATSNDKKRVAIKTRNYVEYNEIFQATYTDCRFIEFVQLGGV